MLVEMAGVVLTVTNSLTLISAAGHGSTVLRLRKRHKTCLRRSTPDESKTICFLHLHKQKTPHLRVEFCNCGRILGYFELLQHSPTLQSDMENYIEGYHSAQLVERENNLESIML